MKWSAKLPKSQGSHSVPTSQLVPETNLFRSWPTNSAMNSSYQDDSIHTFPWPDHDWSLVEEDGPTYQKRNLVRIKLTQTSKHEYGSDLCASKMLNKKIRILAQCLERIIGSKFQRLLTLGPTCRHSNPIWSDQTQSAEPNLSPDWTQIQLCAFNLEI